MTTLSQILEHKIIAIIRGANPDNVFKIANALHEGGIRILEITFNSPNALTVVNELSNQMGKELLIGMGTVLNAATARDAIAAGAQRTSDRLHLRRRPVRVRPGRTQRPAAHQ